MMTKRSTNIRRRGHIRQRGKSWVVTFRVNGEQHWKSFSPREYADPREAAELYLADKLVAIGRREFRVPEKVTFETAAREWLRHGEHERHLKPSTVRDYKSAVNAHLIPAFGPRQLEDVTARAIEEWRGLQMAEGRLPRRTSDKLVAILHGIFERARKAYGFPSNPVDDVERFPAAYSGRFDFYGLEEVWAIVRKAADQQDGAIFLTAAFTGLRRGEVLALRVRDCDFARQVIRVEHSLDGQELGTPKSGRTRSVPMHPDVARVLAKLLERDDFTGQDDFVFVASNGTPLDGSAVRRRYVAAVKRAKLRPLRFHDLRHTFGTIAASAVLSGRELQEWMGHADLKTTARYLHHRARGDEAGRLAEAFKTAAPTASVLQANDPPEGAAPFREAAPVEVEVA
jgi:integrase